MKLYILVLFTWLPGPVGAINFVFWVRPGNASRNYTIIGHPCSRRRALFFQRREIFSLEVWLMGCGTFLCSTAD